MTAAIDTRSLCKLFTSRRRAASLRAAFRQLIAPAYHEHLAVDDVSFRIEPGERVAFVGPNGAGKSTTIKMLSGILQPSSGSASVLGLTPWRERRELAYRIGTVFGQRSQLWYHLPAADSFELLGRIYDRDRHEHRRRQGELVERFGLAHDIEKPVRELSLGQRMRCEIVASLLHDPDLVFLDEPTIGLDVTAKATIRSVLLEQSRHDGKTLLFTSHDTGDMESVCERVIIIHHGRVLVDQSLAELRRTHLRRKLLVLHTAEPSLELSLAGARVVACEPHRIEIELDLDRVAVEQVVQHVMARARLRDLTVSDPPMEEVIRELYGRGASPAAAPPPGVAAPGGGP
jgi:viologen exporter family transport system ATP-binding protein